MVRVIHCSNEAHVRPDQTVGAVQKALKEVLNVSPDAIALVNGKQVPSGHRLVEGDNLEFVSPQGEKGLGDLLTAPDLIERWRISEEQYHELLKRGLPTLCLEGGATFHPEVAVDDWMRRLSTSESDSSTISADLRRIADHFDPPPPDKVGSEYVAQRLGCTTTWIADLVRRAEIPKSCLVPGTGNGKPWKFYRDRIDKWIERR